MGRVCVDHRGQRRTYQDPRGFIQWPSALLGREQEGGEERAFDEFLEDILGGYHELHSKAMALVRMANRLRREVTVTGSARGQRLHKNVVEGDRP